MDAKRLVKAMLTGTFYNTNSVIKCFMQDLCIKLMDCLNTF